MGFVFLLIAFMFCSISAICMFIKSKKGKRLDKHPVCRKCRFDLFGIVSNGNPMPQCPECGTQRPPLIGNRQPYPMGMWISAMLFLLQLSGFAIIGYNAFNTAQLAPHKPLWLLRWETRTLGNDTASIALDEILDRIKNKSLASASLDELIADAVAHGPAGNTNLVNAPIGSKWDALAAELMLAGHGTDTQRIAIAKSWMVLSIETRSHILHENAVPLRIRRKILGPPSPYSAIVKYNDPKIVIDGQTFRLGMSGNGGGSSLRGSGSNGGWSGTSLRPGIELPKHLPSGKHDFQIVLPMSVTNGSSGPAWAQWTETKQASFEYVDSPSNDPIQLIEDPVSATAIEQGTTIENNTIKARHRRSNLTIKFTSVKAPIAYRLFLQRGDQRWEYGSISTRISNNHSFATGGNLPNELEDGAMVDVVFEPAEDIARQTVDLTEILNHRFVIQDVKIVRPATNP